jgi:hypothetical protein
VLGYSRDSVHSFRDLSERGDEVALAEMTKAKPNPQAPGDAGAPEVCLRLFRPLRQRAHQQRHQ